MHAGLRTRIVNLIKKSDSKSLSVNEIYKKLKDSNPQITKIEIKKILREVIDIDSKLKKNNKDLKYFIAANKGGNSFRFTGGGERTKKGTGIYRDITKVFEGDNKNIIKIFDAPHLILYDVHPGKTQIGKWSRPVLIVELYKGIDSTKPFELHSIEFQEEGGFSPENISQARFSGDGADKCWLLFDSKDWPKNPSQRSKNPGADLAKKFAIKLGVGLIYYRNLSRSGDWYMLQPAKKQKRNPEKRKALEQLYEGEKKMRKQKKRDKKIY